MVPEAFQKKLEPMDSAHERVNLGMPNNPDSTCNNSFFSDLQYGATCDQLSINPLGPLIKNYVMYFYLN